MVEGSFTLVVKIKKNSEVETRVERENESAIGREDVLVRRVSGVTRVALKMHKSSAERLERVVGFEIYGVWRSSEEGSASEYGSLGDSRLRVVFYA
ncbi:hypothetical protein Tco_0123116 [Tanacetum coccineum]|uniref:Uncharacterized protein n=1 Tax=Tanacetum coccineum TaxID=301880 RepID=A0ABQ5FHN8_9ASTR